MIRLQSYVGVSKCNGIIVLTYMASFTVLLIPGSLWVVLWFTSALSCASSSSPLLLLCGLLCAHLLFLRVVFYNCWIGMSSFPNSHVSRVRFPNFQVYVFRISNVRFTCSLFLNSLLLFLKVRAIYFSITEVRIWECRLFDFFPRAPLAPFHVYSRLYFPLCEFILMGMFKSNP